jgi:CheY-like chemotaxis protein
MATDLTKTVLVVSDDPAARRDMARLLQDAGFNVATAANAWESLRHLRCDPKPCVVILDLMMPVLDGWSFCEALRTDPAGAHVPVVVCSAAPPSVQHSGSLSLNVLGFHPKPIDPAALLKSVRRLGG